MGLESLKTWHWMLISLIVGAALAYSQLYDLSGKRLTPDESYGDRRTIGLAVLIGKLNLPKTEKGYAHLADLTIYPAIDNRICVTGNELQPVQGKDGIGIYKPFQQVTEVPLKLLNGTPPPSNTYSILDYVKEVQTRNPDLTYRTAWWAVPPITWSIWMGGSFLLVGVLMPTFIRVMMGAGYMPPPKPKAVAKPAYTYTGGDEEIEGLVKEKKGPMTAAQQEQLEALTAKLQQSVGNASVSTGPVQTGASTSAVTAAIKQLDAKPLEEAKPLTDAPKEDVEWGGEFYPVAHSKHHEDEKK